MTAKKFLQICAQRIRSSNHPLLRRMFKPVLAHMRTISERWGEVGRGAIWGLIALIHLTNLRDESLCTFDRRRTKLTNSGPTRQHIIHSKATFLVAFSSSVMTYKQEDNRVQEKINSEIRSYLRGLYCCPFKRLRTVWRVMLPCTYHSYSNESPRNGRGEFPFLFLLSSFSSLFLFPSLLPSLPPSFFVFLQSTLTRCFRIFSARTRGRSPWPGNTKACRPGENQTKGEQNDCSEQLKNAVW